MWELPVIPPTPGLVFLHAPPIEAIPALTTRLALAGPVCVLDTGNQFDAYRIARLARYQTNDIERVLGRIQVARAFTCYQVVTLFAQLPDATVPHVVLDLTATFYDESVPIDESYRLLSVVANHLRRLRHTAPVTLVTVYPPRRQERAGLLRAVLKLADRTFVWDEAQAASPLTLF